MYGTAKSSGSIAESSGYGSSGMGSSGSSASSSSFDPCGYDWGCMYVTITSGGDYEAEMPSSGTEPWVVVGVGEVEVCSLYVSDDISLFIYNGVWHVQIGGDALAHADGAIPDTSFPYGTWSGGGYTLTIEPCCPCDNASATYYVELILDEFPGIPLYYTLTGNLCDGFSDGDPEFPVALQWDEEFGRWILSNETGASVDGSTERCDPLGSYTQPSATSWTATVSSTPF